jgi:hypothetical protein
MAREDGTPTETAAALEEQVASLAGLPIAEVSDLEEQWWVASRRYSRCGDALSASRYAAASTAAVVEQAARAGLAIVGPAEWAELQEPVARNQVLNSCVAPDGWGYPLHPHLQGLTYCLRGVHLRPDSEREAYEEQMLDWVAMGEHHGLTDAQSMHFSLYL